MDAFSLEAFSRAGEALDATQRHSPGLSDAVVEPQLRPVPGARSFELPKAVFVAMGAAYAAFVAEMAVAFGGGEGMPLVLAICVVYMAMYLGIPAVFGRVDTGIRQPLLDWARLRSSGLDTIDGRVSAGGVLAQVLIVPACLAAFGLAILVIVATL
jgi:hypothetical protein